MLSQGRAYLRHSVVQGQQLIRYVTNESGTWERRYKRQTRVEIEEYWKEKLTEKWESREKFPTNEVKPKFYCLSMFPYPSGRLHMGHVRVYTISDTFAQFYRMNGYNVIHPMGWDAFGLPAENAARDRNLDPKEWTLSNIKYMKDQLKNLNLMFDWEREVSTCDPEYYKWTQFIFVKLFQAGLAYQKDALVNWDPVDQTVLADEQVDEDGRSWRSGAVVEQKYMKQWFLKSTEYSEQLLDSLSSIEEDYGVKAMQKNWIGEIDGCNFDFEVSVDNEILCTLPVFCPHPESVMNSSHIVIQSKFKGEIANVLDNHGKKSVADMISNSPCDKEILLHECTFKNPLSGDTLPIIISDQYETKFEKTPLILAIPEVDDIATAMANHYSFQHPNYPSTGSDILAKAKLLGIWNGKRYSSKLRDWLISRQRYWGTPIPIIHCQRHGAVAVPAEKLPVQLPEIEDVSIKPGQSPLDSVHEWVDTSCPKCGLPAKRETDTMDTFVDSSWYFLRYTDPLNTDVPFSRKIADQLMPVDLYIGGKEHAVLHLYFARFINHFLADQEYLRHKEPFKKLLSQGLIKGLTHQVKSTGKYISLDDVDKTAEVPVTKDGGELVEESFQKMSKSKFNGIDPEDFVKEWGISITRLYVLYAAAPFEDIHWNVKTDVIPGVMRLQLKLWTCVTKIIDARKGLQRDSIDNFKADIAFLRKVNNLNGAINQAIQDITGHYRNDCVLSAAITCLMVLGKILSNIPGNIITYSAEFERGLSAIIIMAAPMVPHFSSELWCGMQLMQYKLTEQVWESDVLEQPWPKPKPPLVRFEDYKIYVDGGFCVDLNLPAVVNDWCGMKRIVLGNRSVQKSLWNNEPAKFKVDEDGYEIHICTS